MESLGRINRGILFLEEIGLELVRKRNGTSDVNGSQWLPNNGFGDYTSRGGLTHHFQIILR